MKLLPILAGVLLFLLPAGTAPGQISRAFPDGVLLPNSQSKPVALASANDTAVLIPTLAPAAYVHERNAGGAWPLTQTIPGSFSAAAVNGTGTQLALAREGLIDLYFRSGGPGTWTLFGNAALSGGAAARKLAFQGDRVVALVTNYSVSPGGDFVRIFEYNAADWEMVKELRINNTDEFVQVGRESVVSDFSMYGNRIAVSSEVEKCVRIHERSIGDLGIWGLEKEITAAGVGVAKIGSHLALHSGRLAAVATVGDIHRIDVFGQNLGGANQWGFSSTLDTVPVDEIDQIILHADVTSGRLAALGSTPFSVNNTSSNPSRLWVFSGVLGWTIAAEMEVGRSQGFPLVAPGLGFAADDLLHGLGPANATGLGASWLASIHRRHHGGPDQWGQELTLAGPGTATRLGTSMAAAGQYVVAGMPADSSGGLESGCAMVWYQARASGGSVWLPVGRVQATVPVAGAKFGTSVAVMEGPGTDWLAVGAPGENSGRGAVYVFPLSPFFAQPASLRIVPPTALNPNDDFGASLSFRRDFHLAVGAPGDDAAGSNAGAIYLFEKDLGGTEAWGRRVKINRPGGEVRISFGKSVAFTSDHLAIALPPATPGPGKVFLHSQNTGGTNVWGQISSQLPPVGSPQGFGASLAADPSFSSIVIGATGRAPDDKNGIVEIPGNVYIFTVSETGVWTPHATLGGTLADGHGFGDSVATAAVGSVVVGNAGFNGMGKTFSYGVTSFSPPTWSLLHTRQGTVAGDGLGIAVASRPMFSFSSAPWSDLAGTDAGALFVDRSGAYELWAATQGPPFTDWHPEADADGDGLPNLGEFGLGGNPMSAASRPPFTMTHTTFVNGLTSWPALRWDPPSLPYPVGMLRYQFRNSFNLTQWSNTTADGGFGLGDPPGRFFRITPPREFFRIDFRYPDQPEGSGPLILE